jgi:hypothetical protein
LDVEDEIDEQYDGWLQHVLHLPQFEQVVEKEQVVEMAAWV